MKRLVDRFDKFSFASSPRNQIAHYWNLNPDGHDPIYEIAARDSRTAASDSWSAAGGGTSGGT